MPRSCVLLALLASAVAGAVHGAPAVARGSAKEARTVVRPEVMQSIHDQVATPHKYGIVLRGEGGDSIDCPCVFRYRDTWYMVYIHMNQVGYETCLAESPDLLHWVPLGTVLPFAREGWDAWQAGGGLALTDTRWGGSYRLETYEDKYWMSYVGGALQGYETDPLSVGLACTEHPDRAQPWDRFPGNPILQPSDPTARSFEGCTLYRSQIIHDHEATLGHPFVMFYNAKQSGDWVERIGMAVSDDMTAWTRYGDGPVVDNGSGITGDPQITRIGDVWVMFYFGAFWQPKAFDTFACSYDLVHWTKWTGPNLVQPSEPWDDQFAHKPWVVCHDGVVYHFYCAVGDQGRCIAVATSRDLRG
jgi:predicted GH43/DUF377 family glycosyl hydrolase